MAGIWPPDLRLVFEDSRQAAIVEWQSHEAAMMVVLTDEARSWFVQDIWTPRF
jgi:hypothetical protein